MMKKTPKPTLRQKWNGFVEFMHRPKTLFDLKDRGKWLLFYAAVCLILRHLVSRLLEK